MNIYDERIRPLFDGSPLTNAELERKIGIKPKTINKWNSGYVKSYDKYISQIASYFHVSTDYLLGNTDDPSPAGQKESPPQGGEPLHTIQDWEKALDGMGQEQLKQVMDLVMKKFMEGGK